MIHELAAIVAAAPRHVRSEGWVLTETVGGVIDGLIAAGFLVWLLKLCGTPEAKRPLGCWAVPVAVIGFAWWAWHSFAALIFASLNAGR